MKGYIWNSLLEHSRVEAWRGNHPRSMELLDRYQKDFGEDRDYLQDKARLLAWAARPDSAMAIVSRLLQEDPTDFNARYTKGIALRNDRAINKILLTVSSHVMQYRLAKGFQLPAAAR